MADHFSPQTILFEANTSKSPSEPNQTPAQTDSIPTSLRAYETLFHRFQDNTPQPTDREKTQEQALFLAHKRQAESLRVITLNKIQRSLQDILNKYRNLEKARSPDKNESIEALLSQSQKHFSQLKDALHSDYLKHSAPSEKSLGYLKPILISLIQKLEALVMGNQSAFEMVSNASQLWSRLKSSPELSSQEKIALLKLNHNLSLLAVFFFKFKSPVKTNQHQLMPPKTTETRTIVVTLKAGLPLQNKLPFSNQLGVPIKALSASYESYLKAGYYWLQSTQSKRFGDKKVLKKSIKAFYWAISTHPQRASAYFGLAYVHTLFEHYAEAQIFLKQAKKYASFEEIQRFEEKLESL